MQPTARIYEKTMEEGDGGGTRGVRRETCIVDCCEIDFFCVVVFIVTRPGMFYNVKFKYMVQSPYQMQEVPKMKYRNLLQVKSL